MTERLRNGLRLFGAASETECIVVTAPSEPVAITIGGHPPLASANERGDATLLDGHDGGCVMGKRYVNADESVEVLCVKPGAGAVAVDGVLLTEKGASPLPSSD